MHAKNGIHLVKFGDETSLANYFDGGRPPTFRKAQLSLRVVRSKVKQQYLTTNDTNTVKEEKDYQRKCGLRINNRDNASKV